MEHRMNWSKTEIVAFQNDFRKDVSLNRFSLIPHPTSSTKKVQIFFHKSIKRRLAIIDYKPTFGYNTRLHTFDSFWLSSAYSVFLTAVILFYFTICSPLSTVLCLFNVLINVITTSCNHPRSLNSTALLFQSLFTLMKTYC